MRTVVVSSICISAIVLVVMIHTDINERASCKQELEEALSLSVSQTVKEVMEQKGYGIENRNEFIAAFLQALILRTNSEADMTVSVITADMEKGLLDIEVKEYLPDRRMPGKGGESKEPCEIVVRRTVVFEKENTGMSGR